MTIRRPLIGFSFHLVDGLLKCASLCIELQPISKSLYYSLISVLFMLSSPKVVDALNFSITQPLSKLDAISLLDPFARLV